MSTESKHTPTPWRVEPEGASVPGYDVCERISGAKYTGRCSHHGLSADDAALIVEAVNGYAALQSQNAALTQRVELLERALRRSAALIDRLYEGGPDCDCTMDGGSHTCGWPELRATREQNHRALTHAGEKA